MADVPVVDPTPISGFPEWLPEVRSVELDWLDRIRITFERYGFCSIETPSVESLDVLASKGETSQEIYTLRRLHADVSESSDARLGLHFDLTVPFARYVAQHHGDLVFPFKRYQIQRVWRGERPQEGRYREFTQCDIDIINPERVPMYFDAELPRIICDALTQLELPTWTIGVNNRKILQGFYEGLGIQDPMAVIRIADKVDKIGVEGVGRMLSARLGLASEQIDACIGLAQVRGADASVIEMVRGFGLKSDLLSQGLDELEFVLESLSDLPSGYIVADLSIARGLDYYTGTVYEGKFVEWSNYGSICSGGRYENLAGSFTRRTLPGVGLSIGLTRILAKVLAEGLLASGSRCPSTVLVVIPSDDLRPEAVTTAAQLRARGLNTELYHDADRVAKQIRYASRKGIPYVWFPPFAVGNPHEVKNLATGEQIAADPVAWTP